ncbi:Autophagy-related protein 9 [Astathelohania contejeani]|uniref:Autophagy-related protein 9 n=1 Tax=Astathelohania contejeani TaxID=164912 RepID=A0ABQ7I2F5_9MICR|nr:Autophagy-related protein 9 [Thelohania contejeani]
MEEHNIKISNLFDTTSEDDNSVLIDGKLGAIEIKKKISLKYYRMESINGNHIRSIYKYYITPPKIFFFLRFFNILIPLAMNLVCGLLFRMASDIHGGEWNISFNWITFPILSFVIISCEITYLLKRSFFYYRIHYIFKYVFNSRVENLTIDTLIKKIKQNELLINNITYKKKDIIHIITIPQDLLKYIIEKRYFNIFLCKKQFYSILLETIIQEVIIKKVLSQHMASTDKTKLVHIIYRNMIIISILLIIFSPFIFFLFLLYYLVSLVGNAAQGKQWINKRTYSSYNKMKLRRYGEMPHHFKRRLELSEYYGNKYLQVFPNDLIELIKNILIFILSICLLFIIYALFLILYEHIEDIKNTSQIGIASFNFAVQLKYKNKLITMINLSNMLYAIGTFSFIIKILRTNTNRKLLSTKKILNKWLFLFKYQEDGNDIYTHPNIIKWYNNGREYWVYKEFVKMYQLEFILILKESLSAFIVPIQLLKNRKMIGNIIELIFERCKNEYKEWA